MKKFLILFIALIVSSMSCVFVLKTVTKVDASIFETNVEALSACEIEKKGEIIFECRTNEGECEKSYLGYTLTCTGIEVGN